MKPIQTTFLVLLAALLIGCGSDNYSETTPDAAKAAREKIKEAEGKLPGAPQ